MDTLESTPQAPGPAKSGTPSTAVGAAVVVPPVKPALGDIVMVAKNVLVEFRSMSTWKVPVTPVCSRTIHECAVPAFAQMRFAKDAQLPPAPATATLLLDSRIVHEFTQPGELVNDVTSANINF